MFTQQIIGNKKMFSSCQQPTRTKTKTTITKTIHLITYQTEQYSFIDKLKSKVRLEVLNKKVSWLTVCCMTLYLTDIALVFGAASTRRLGQYKQYRTAEL